MHVYFADKLKIKQEGECSYELYTYYGGKYIVAGVGRKFKKRKILGTKFINRPKPVRRKNKKS